MTKSRRVAFSDLALILRRQRLYKGLFLFCLTGNPVLPKAAGPQGDAQIYPLLGRHKNQVVMLSNWSEGKVFAEYEDYRKLTREFFAPNQDVWIWCGGTAGTNRIHEINTSKGSGMEIAKVILEHDPQCQKKPLLMSNYQFPRNDWSVAAASPAEVEAIRRKLARQGLKITKIMSDRNGRFFFVFDPTIPEVYEMGGYRLLDDRLNELSSIDNAPLTPLIDLDGDGFPEFFYPSSDGLDAWLYKLYPTAGKELSLFYTRH